ncbi:argininosuccinate synthase [Halobacterium sp. R2-5]|uniref:argininosuccinate synthase n=1 Tax=Halobacterium sp. R2-5 TaxID=2715751 RepID=UPI001422B881|nr:argininosuccinate synthase [Halobacterium sp. R2-5]NIB98249.1 argininosuccinate synthase [Halobacterium sp. R2-5]
MTEGTVALAFSGGLDTTVCVPLLKEEYGYDDVIGVTVDVGQPDAEFAEARETADALGVEHYVVDAKAEFADLCFDAVQANATYQGYPLGTALARPVIAEAILGVAEEHDCAALAHGCTGKGNDQLRFEAVWRASDLEVIAPVRELGLTREWEIDYAAEKGLPVEAGNDGEWSIDTNLWSRSVEGGQLEDPGYEPPADIYDWTDAPGDETETIDISFESGVPVAVNGNEMEPVPLIEYLNDLAGSYGVGRTDMMEDRMLGLKVRENYEHPAATTLLTAHEALEQLVFTKDEREFSQQISQQWSEKAYEGLVDHPLMDALNGFLAETQQKVTGTVTVKFEGGQARPVARDSEYAVYSADAASFDTETVNGIEQGDATGVAKYHGFQSRLANASKPEIAPDGGAAGSTDGDEE